MDLTKTLNLDAVERFDGEFNGEKYWIEVKASALTPAFHQSLVAENAEPMALAEEMAKRITDWDLFLKEPGDYPPTVENIGNLPKDAIHEMVNIVAASWAGDKKKVKASANG